MRVSGLIRLSALLFALVAIWIFLRNSSSFSRKTIRLPRWLGERGPLLARVCVLGLGTALHPRMSQARPLRRSGWKRTSVGSASPAQTTSLRLKSAVGLPTSWALPCALKMKFHSCTLFLFPTFSIMSPVKNNVGRGLNIALVNGSTGHLLRQGSFDMYSGDPKLLEKFLVEIPEGVLVLVASYDDPGTKMNDEIRKLFSNLGSVYAKHLGFRDSWVFLGARDLKNKSPFEQFLKNSPGTNKYEGWPELLELEGCVPRKVF
ncbi:protein FAM3D isoform X2 [Dipodomys merriami]|uniref:protein FAM3D isoform X2 n=1 Tax=Dipodomys merriami TaxID=94247 RepID=UPI00384CBC54